MTIENAPLNDLLGQIATTGEQAAIEVISQLAAEELIQASIDEQAAEMLADRAHAEAISQIAPITIRPDIEEQAHNEAALKMDLELARKLRDIIAYVRYQHYNECHGTHEIPERTVLLKQLYADLNKAAKPLSAYIGERIVEKGGE